MRAYFLNFPVDCWSVNALIDLLEKRMNAGNHSRIVTLNPEMVIAAQSSPALQKAISWADFVIPDGIGIVLTLRCRGYRVERMTGIDLAYLLMARLAKRGGKVYILGGAPGVAMAAAGRLQQELAGLQVVGTMDGFFSTQDEQRVTHQILSAKPDLLIVGMGMPRQELWLDRHWTMLKVPIGIGVGGSIDIWAGRIQRAPAFMRKLGLEWLYRVWVQPWRWRRLLKLVKFIMVAAGYLGRKRVDNNGGETEQDKNMDEE